MTKPELREIWRALHDVTANAQRDYENALARKTNGARVSYMSAEWRSKEQDARRTPEARASERDYEECKNAETYALWRYRTA